MAKASEGGGMFRYKKSHGGGSRNTVRKSDPHYPKAGVRSGKYGKGGKLCK